MFFQEFLKEKLTVILEKLISKKSIDLLKQNDLKFNVERVIKEDRKIRFSLSKKKQALNFFSSTHIGSFFKVLIL